MLRSLCLLLMFAFSACKQPFSLSVKDLPTDTLGVYLRLELGGHWGPDNDRTLFLTEEYSPVYLPFRATSERDFLVLKVRMLDSLPVNSSVSEQLKRERKRITHWTPNISLGADSLFVNAHGIQIGRIGYWQDSSISPGLLVFTANQRMYVLEIHSDGSRTHVDSLVENICRSLSFYYLPPAQTAEKVSRFKKWIHYTLKIVGANRTEILRDSTILIIGDKHDVSVNTLPTPDQYSNNELLDKIIKDLDSLDERPAGLFRLQYEIRHIYRLSYQLDKFIDTAFSYSDIRMTNGSDTVVDYSLQPLSFHYKRVSKEGVPLWSYYMHDRGGVLERDSIRVSSQIEEK